MEDQGKTILEIVKKRLKEGPIPTIEDKIIKSSKRGFQFTGEIKTIKSVKS